MPEAPKIFLSASTPDLRSARQAACDALHAMGCQPVVAEHSFSESGAFWHSLQPVIRECRAVVHLIGYAYGDEPDRRQPAEHRRSYAQLEYDLAVSLRRPLSILICTERFPFDSPPSEDTEKQRLQQTHRNFVQGGGRAFQFVENHAEMLSVLFALRVPGMAPIVPVLPAPSVKPARIIPVPPPMLPPAQPVSRRRILRWVALGLMVCMLLFIVGGALVAWLLFKHGFGTAGIASATPHTVSTPRVAEAAPHLPTPAPRGMVAPPARQSSPVPLVAAPARQSTPVPLVAPATKPSPPSPVIALNPTPAVAPTPAAVPVGPEHTPAKIPDGVRADRSPVDSATRKAIVDRITLAPDIPAEKKEKVREIVNRAREMRRVLVLPFPSGQAELGTADAAALRNLVRAPEFAPYREDPTCAFIVLGFADTRGADDYNLRLSTDRARTVRDLLRRDSALPNIIHPVGLGKTTLLDEQQLEKNRIVEVWVIRL